MSDTAPQEPLNPESIQPAVPLWLKPSFHMLLVILVGLLVYSNTINSSFQFDDLNYIINNPAMMNWDYFTKQEAMQALEVDPNLGAHFRNRIVGFFTFAINYRIHTDDPRGYHLVNLLIHIVTALGLYKLISELFKSPALRGISALGGQVAFWCALLFVCHPIQTQAVTYIAQRFTSLAAMFYIGALWLYVRSRLEAAAERSVKLYAYAMLAGFLAVKTKEIAVTLPAMALLLELCFFEADWKFRARRLVPMFLMALIVPLTIMYQKGFDIQGAMGAANFKNVPRYEYFLTQFNVMATYLRLMVLPVSQNLDYDYPLVKSASQIIGAALLHMALLGAGLWMMIKGRRRCMGLMLLAGFGIWWFYIAMAVDSSVIPLQDIINEHRVYLSAAGFAMVAVAAALWLMGRVPARAVVAVGVVATLALSGAAYARNRVWKDELTLWKDIAAKSPNKARVHNNLGHYLNLEGDSGQAMAEFERAVELDPQYSSAFFNLGKVYKEFDTKRAIEAFEKAVKYPPFYAYRFNMLGRMYYEDGRIDDSIATFRRGLKYADDPAIFETIGNIYFNNKENYQKAAYYYELAKLRAPDSPRVYVRLWQTYSKLGDKVRAEENRAVAARYEEDSSINDAVSKPEN